MLVVEKARHIEVEIRGPGAESVLAILRRELPSLETSDDDTYDPVENSDWFAALAAEVTPGQSLRVYRDNAGWTQAQLSEKTGIPVPHLSGMENDKRSIGKAAAKKLASALGTDYRRFV
jgi:DNA-binding XRE family transcriptional regulator